MNDLTFSRTVFKGRNFSIDLFFHFPKVILSEKGNFSEEFYPILYVKQSTFGPDPSGNAWADKRVKIRPKGLVRFVKLINDACRLLEKEDIFLVDSQNELVFNLDYGKMERMMERAEPDDGFITICPSIVTEGAAQKPVEGVIIYLNKRENMFMVTRHELESLLWTLKNFSFTEEANHLLMAALYAQTNNMIIPQSQVKKLGPF